MIILGIDPGTAITGYGVIHVENRNSIQCVSYGVIRTDKALLAGERLVEISDDIIKIIEKYKPAYVGIEQLFFANNTKTAMTVGQARGVILAEIYRRHIPCKEFTPLQIKQAMTGHGRATKNQIQEAVKLWLKLPTIPTPDDAADGLAIALAVAHSINF